jgi:hypothetical protein
VSETPGGESGNPPGGRRRRPPGGPHWSESPGPDQPIYPSSRRARDRPAWPEAPEDVPPEPRRSFFGGPPEDRYQSRGQARGFFGNVPGYDEIETEHDKQLADHYLYTGWFDPFASSDERNAARQNYYDISYTDGTMFPWDAWHREVYGE